VPGRKTVLLLSEGLVVPWEVENVFQAIIGAANRANVSIYCVDVTGLSVKSPATANTDLLRTSARISQNQGMAQRETRRSTWFTRRDGEYELGRQSTTSHGKSGGRHGRLSDRQYQRCRQASA